jgi:hypothetical protein
MKRNRYFDRVDETHKRAKEFHAKGLTLEGAPHATTLEHYEKYREMLKDSGLAVTDLGSLHVKSLDALIVRYLQDRALNSIPLRHFDLLYIGYRVYNSRPKPGAPRTNAEYVCCLKHYLIYNVLGLVPEFEEYTE